MRAATPRAYEIMEESREGVIWGNEVGQPLSGFLGRIEKKVSVGRSSLTGWLGVSPHSEGRRAGEPQGGNPFWLGQGPWG